jgi:hypothetical protein
MERIRVRRIFNGGCIVSSMLFVNNETMTCNVFELINIIIRVMIRFGQFF